MPMEIRGEDLMTLFFFFFSVLAVMVIMRQVLSHGRGFRAEKTRADILNRLIDKFGSSQELMTYLQSDAGKEILAAPLQDRRFPLGRIVAVIQLGVVFLIFSLTMFLLRHWHRYDLAPDFKLLLLVIGYVTVALGLGLVISALLSYCLSKRWGLLNGKNGSRS